MKTLLLTLLFGLLAGPGWADEPRYRSSFTSKNGLYELRLLRTDSAASIVTSSGERLHPSIYTWGVFATLTRHQLYSFQEKNDLITSKTALISNDGNSLAVLDDWSAAVPWYKLDVLTFYERGRLIRSYTLGDFLCSCGSISSSVSHFDWLSSYRFSPFPNTLTIATFELNTFVFDITNGQLLTKKPHPAITPSSLLVAGQVQKLAPHQYELTVSHRMHGTVPANGKVRFTSPAKLRPGDYLTLLIDQNQHIGAPGLYERSNLNEGSYKYEQKLKQEVEALGGFDKLTAEQKEFVLGMGGCP
jgi:hypothetical protein